MPPAASQKGTGKKAGPGAMRQRSRNTTPSSIPAGSNLPSIENIDTEYLSLRVEQFREVLVDDLVDGALPMPDSKNVDGIIAKLNRLQEAIDRRTNFCDKAMRDIANQRKHHVDEPVERPERDDEQRKGNKKKRKAADSLAPGDVNKGMCCNSIVFCWSCSTGDSPASIAPLAAKSKFQLILTFDRTLFTSTRFYKAAQARICQLLPIACRARIAIRHGCR